MTLVPATGVVRTVAKAAQKDPAGTSELVRLALFETLSDFIEADREELDREISKVMNQRAGLARRQLVRQYVSKRLDGGEVDELLAVAEHWNTVAKALWGPKHPFDESQVRRDERGRFTFKISGRDHATSAYRAASTLGALRARGMVTPGQEVVLVGPRVDENGQITRDVIEHAHKVGETQAEDQSAIGAAPVRVDELHAHIDRGSGNRRAAYDVTAAVTGNPGFAHHITRNAPLEQDNFKQALQDWTRESGSSRAFRRANMVGQVLQDQSKPGSTPHTVGGVAQLVGTLGPQAEEVLGRNLRRTAYRYRGTEQRPDPELVANVEAVGLADLTRESSANQALRPPVDQRGGVTRNLRAYYAHPGAQAARGIDTDTDALELRLRGDAASAYFIRKLPNPKIAELTSQSGRAAPPSQGAIINSHGRVVTQAQGFADDHYLPFDLKNLSGLQGGQYVRTRVGGGPTEEDLYTGLLAGARQIQTVSNTGVFTVEFDPDVRGGRRYSDKARGMINRYAALIGLVAESGNESSEKEPLYAQDVDDGVKAKLKAQAYRDMGYDPKSSETEYKRLLHQARMEESFRAPAEAEQAERSKIREQVLAEYEYSDPTKTTRDVANEVEDRYQKQRRDLEEKRVRRLSLNGEGYFRALRALQQEFPYYIRNVDYQPLRDFGTERGLGGPFGGSPNFPDPNYQPPGGAVMRPGRGSTAEAAEGEGRPRAGGAVVPTGGGPTSGGGGAALAIPGVSAPAPPHKVDPLSELAKRQPAYIRESQKSMSRLANLIGLEVPGSAAIPEKADDIDLADWAGGNSFDYVRALAKKAGDARRLPAYVADQSKVTDEQAQQAVEAVRDLQNVQRRMPSYDNSVNAEDVTTAADQLALVVAARKPFDDPHDPFELYDPGETGLPQRFAAIDALGDNPANYQHLLDTVQKDQLSAKPFLAAVGELSDLSPAARREWVSDRVARYNTLLEWGKRTDASTANRPPELDGISLSEAKAAVANEKTNKFRQQLGAAQAAWAFVHGRDLASIARAGGGGAPFAPPAQAAGQQLPQLDDPQQRRKPDPGLPNVGKADGLVLLHPPGQDQGWRLVSHLLGLDPQ